MKKLILTLAILTGLCFSYTTAYATEEETHKHIISTDTEVASTSVDGSIIKYCEECNDILEETVIYSPKTVKVLKPAYTYTGSNKKPAVKVYDTKGKLIAPEYYTVTYPKSCKNVGYYNVTVTFKGLYKGTLKGEYKIVPKKTSVKKLVSKVKGFDVTIAKRDTQVSGYEIQYSTSKKYNSIHTSTKTFSKKTTKKTVTGIAAGKNYYVRVRTYKNVKKNGKTVKIYSGWSKAKTVKTKWTKFSSKYVWDEVLMKCVDLYNPDHGTYTVMSKSWYKKNHMIESYYSKTKNEESISRNYPDEVVYGYYYDGKYRSIRFNPGASGELFYLQTSKDYGKKPIKMSKAYCQSILNGLNYERQKNGNSPVVMSELEQTIAMENAMAMARDNHCEHHYSKKYGKDTYWSYLESIMSFGSACTYGTGILLGNHVPDMLEDELNGEPIRIGVGAVMSDNGSIYVAIVANAEDLTYDDYYDE